MQNLGPYRTPWAPDSAAPVRAEVGMAAPLAPVLAMVALVAIVRVACAVGAHEDFSAEPTLALLSVLALGWAAFAGRRRS